jgi:hypothetical protein
MADTPVDNSSRREVAAFDVVRLLRLDRPKDFEALSVRVRAEGQLDRQAEILEEWCKSIGLSCEPIKMAALHLALDPKDKPAGAIKLILWTDAEGQLHDHRLEWIPGETKKAFLARAENHFNCMKDLERQGGNVIEVKPVNRRHLDWLIRFQVKQERITRIATANSTDPKEVRRVLRSVAALLELDLRETVPGRPRGRRDSSSRNRHIARR